MAAARKSPKAQAKTKGSKKAARKRSLTGQKESGKARPVRAQGADKRNRPACPATDPFGGPCQSTPRPPSRYCTMHSYLDR